MFVKHSIKNVLRSSKKSVLFLILIIMIVVIMSIGMSLSVMIKDILKDCEENYTTVAKLEYMGVWYPTEGVYDSNVKDALQNLDIIELAKNPAVLAWDSTEYALGFTEGRMDVNNLAMLKSYAVLVVRANNFKEDEQVYDAIVAQDLYSYENVQDMMIYINPMGFELTKGHYYLVNCRFYYGDSAYKHVTLTPFYNVAAENDGIDGSTENMLIDVTNESGTGYTIPQDSYFYDIADSYAVINKCYNVQATNDIEALFPFQQNILYLTSGRYFTEDEYASGAKVCVMPQYLAQNLNLELGDTFEINFAYESEASQSGSYWAPTGFDVTIE
ncbi:MAG TPA: hypothetical protein PK675_03360, partial [Clostridia bacterium]|nr:hypothetical protein [Clostridia bacterium]